MKNDLKNRDDIHLLVNSFYGKVKEDEILGPIFNDIVDDWPRHMAIITDFWETNLFLNKSYKRNPIAAHQRADKALGYIIEQEHFSRWLQIWFKTIDNMYKGDNAIILKNRARKMSTFMFIRIFDKKPKH